MVSRERERFERFGWAREETEKWGYEGTERSVMAMEYGPHTDAYKTFLRFIFTKIPFLLFFNYDLLLKELN